MSCSVKGGSRSCETGGGATSGRSREGPVSAEVILSLLLFTEAAEQEGHDVKQQRAYNSRQPPASQ